MNSAVLQLQLGSFVLDIWLLFFSFFSLGMQHVRTRHGFELSLLSLAKLSRIGLDMTLTEGLRHLSCG